MIYDAVFTYFSLKILILNMDCLKAFLSSSPYSQFMSLGVSRYSYFHFLFCSSHFYSLENLKHQMFIISLFSSTQHDHFRIGSMFEIFGFPILVKLCLEMFCKHLSSKTSQLESFFLFQFPLAQAIVHLASDYISADYILEIPIFFVRVS